MAIPYIAIREFKVNLMKSKFVVLFLSSVLAGSAFAAKESVTFDMDGSPTVLSVGAGHVHLVMEQASDAQDELPAESGEASTSMPFASE